MTACACAIDLKLYTLRHSSRRRPLKLSVLLLPRADAKPSSPPLPLHGEDIAARLVRATLKGWNYAVKNQKEAVGIVLERRSAQQQDVAAEVCDGRDGAPGRLARMSRRAAQPLRLVSQLPLARPGARDRTKLCAVRCDYGRAAIACKLR